MIQILHPYMTTGKIIALIICTFVYKVMSLLFNMLSSLPKLIFQEVSVFYFMASVTVHSYFGAKENKVCYCFYFSPIYLS